MHDPTLSPAPPSDHPTVRFDGRRVLVVEDDRRMLEFIRVSLVRRGASVVTATGLAQAMSVDWDSIDYVLTDGFFRDGTALDLLPMLRQHRRLSTVPVLVYTGSALPGIDEQLRAAGADAVEHKPMSIHLLMHAFHALVARGDRRTVAAHAP